jgi:hypothetical protein
MLRSCVPAALRIVREIIDGQIQAAVLNAVGYVFLYVFMNQTLWHCRRSSTLAINPPGRKLSGYGETDCAKLLSSGKRRREEAVF